MMIPFELVSANSILLQNRRYGLFFYCFNFILQCAQPYCHNQIESMSCGAIPLFQDFPYYPGLINGFNCISYSDFSGLCNEVNKILEGNIPRNELLLMSSRINELYNTHYSKKAIKLAFDSFVEDSNIIQEDYYICPKEN